jgi:ABC-type lipoprotein export system ATPase subunit
MAPRPTTTSTAIECRGVSVEYRTPSGAATALDSVDATFEHGRLTVIAGPSGSGKSTLLRVLGALQRPSAGTVLLDGRDVTRLRAGARRRLRRAALGIVLQAPADNLLEHLSALEQVELTARLRGAPRAEARRLLATVGLEDRGGCSPAELSGGEQQRVAFAAAAIGSPRVLLADEPTAQLDSHAGQHLLRSLGELVRAGSTVVIASHDPDAVEVADAVLWLRDGQRVAA